MATFWSSSSNGYQLELVVSAGTQNIANNTTVVSWALYLHNGYKTIDSPCAGSATVGGSHAWGFNAQFTLLSQHQRRLLGSGSKTVKHNADGTGSAYSVAHYYSHTQGYIWSIPRLDVNGTISLTRIPRGPRVRSGGVWKQTVAYVRVGGVWKIAIPYVRSGGVWKIGGG